MVHGCYDGVECSEEQHQENRRTECMITGFANGKKQVSVKPSNILTNPCSNCNAAPDLESDEVIEEVEEEEEALQTPPPKRRRERSSSLDRSAF